MPDKADEIASTIRDLEAREMELAQLDGVLESALGRVRLQIEAKRTLLEDAIENNKAALTALGYKAKAPAKRAETRPGPKKGER